VFAEYLPLKFGGKGTVCAMQTLQITPCRNRNFAKTKVPGLGGDRLQGGKGVAESSQPIPDAAVAQRAGIASP
jgi:hypothetical protein